MVSIHMVMNKVTLSNLLSGYMICGWLLELIFCDQWLRTAFLESTRTQI
jgi:hypothetical protein